MLSYLRDSYGERYRTESDFGLTAITKSINAVVHFSTINKDISDHVITFLTFLTSKSIVGILIKEALSV